MLQAAPAQQALLRSLPDDRPAHGHYRLSFQVFLGWAADIDTGVPSACSFSRRDLIPDGFNERFDQRTGLAFFEQDQSLGRCAACQVAVCDLRWPAIRPVAILITTIPWSTLSDLLLRRR